MSAPSVYAAIHAVSADLAKLGIDKTRVNEADDYRYRSIDDVLERLAPLLSKHRLCILPRALKRHAADRQDEGHLLTHVCLKVAFRLTSVDDGSIHIVESFGEAMDASDKASAKAMSAAYKSAMIQTFCIPVVGTEDPDRSSPRATGATHVPEPVQGWESWAADIGDIVDHCESLAAIQLVQERNRELLKALSRERQEIYRELGARVTARTGQLQTKPPPSRGKVAKGRAVRAKVTADG